MTSCDDVRVVLPDHALGSIDDPDDVPVRAHLRACAACRRELEALREGLGVFGSTLDRPAPAGLRDRVLDVLAAEWADRAGPVRAPVPDPRARLWRVAAAAAVVLAVVAGAFGLAQWDRADGAAADAESYRTVLATLGGTGFRVGTLEPTGTTPVSGSVVAYESSHDQSFVVLFVRVPGLVGDGGIVAARADGTTWEPAPLEFDGDGDAAAWWVTDRSIGGLTGLTVTAPDGSTLATASIVDA